MSPFFFTLVDVRCAGGEIIEISAYYTRILTTYASRSDFYALEYGEGEVIDACLKGNNARFVNREFCIPSDGPGLNRPHLVLTPLF